MNKKILDSFPTMRKFLPDTFPDVEGDDVVGRKINSLRVNARKMTPAYKRLQAEKAAEAERNRQAEELVVVAPAVFLKRWVSRCPNVRRSTKTYLLSALTAKAGRKVALGHLVHVLSGARCTCQQLRP